jgi:hypothetical protein
VVRKVEAKEEAKEEAVSEGCGAAREAASSVPALRLATCNSSV